MASLNFPSLPINGQQYTSNNVTYYYDATIGAWSTAIVYGGTLSDSKGDLRNLPLNNKTTSYTLVLSDAGKLVSVNNTVTIPNAIFFEGNVISIYNNSSAGGINVTNAGAVTMYLAGSTDSNTRNLTARGIASIICVAANTFVVSGAGLS